MFIFYFFINPFNTSEHFHPFTLSSNFISNISNIRVNLSFSIDIDRPTQHKGFASHESYEQAKYEAAQSIGENGHDCDDIYPECENSMLQNFSYLAE